jgi:hypothetical protein
VLDALDTLARRQQRGGIIDIERLADPQGTLYAFSQPLLAVHGPLPTDGWRRHQHSAQPRRNLILIVRRWSRA